MAGTWEDPTFGEEQEWERLQDEEGMSAEQAANEVWGEDPDRGTL